MNQVIFIGILNFNAFESKGYQSRHLILNLETKDQDLSDIEFNFIELPKFKKKEAELTTMLEKWIYFLKHASDLQVMPENTDAVDLKAAYDIAERFRWSRDDLEVYDYLSMKVQDERGALVVAERRGEKRGIEQGDKAARIATARVMLADGLDAAIITKYTGLTIDELVHLSLPSENKPDVNI